jgi:16S rRNA (adenine1518-N6/adenine1519-N6)-dimethyltransferase
MVRLKKGLGQHLLLSEGVLEKLADLVDPGPGDTVVEIGPGTGNLTLKLLERKPKKLIALEKDPEMVKVLRKIENPALEVIEGDATRTDLCSFGQDLKVCGNLPYNVASLIIENVVFHHRCVREGVFMTQKEVALKLSGKERGSWLGAFLETFFEVTYLMSVPSRFFLPRPKVSSGVIKIKKKATAEGGPSDLSKYKKFLLRLFSERKKMLRSKFGAEVLKKAGVDPSWRVHQLSPAQILRLYNVYEEVE